MAPRRLLCGILGAFALLAAPAPATTYYAPTQAANPPKMFDTNSGPVTTRGQDLCMFYGIETPFIGSSCSTSGSSWTFHIHPDYPSECAGNCGMNHTYWWNDLTRRPWATSTGVLSFSLDYSVSRVIVPGDWHGYFCVQLADAVSANVLLYCLEPWRPTFGYAPETVNWDSTVNAFTGTWGGYDAWTHFGAGATLATAAPGSQTSSTPPVGGHYAAYITRQQLQSVLVRANAGVARGEPNNGRFGPYSTDPANYAVVAFQCGGEGYGGMATDVIETCGNVTIGDQMPVVAVSPVVPPPIVAVHPVVPPPVPAAHHPVRKARHHHRWHWWYSWWRHHRW